jgi:uncharacterized protein YprB with RNaseH-like and TPR domain
LCGVVKPAHGPSKVFRADQMNPRWRTCRSDDRAVLEAIVAELGRYDIWVAYNGASFDVPFLRTRLMHWDLPPLPDRKLVDPLLLARRKLRLSFNSLEQLAHHLRVGRKRRVAPDAWLRAGLDGCPRAMDLIARHCEKDVRLLVAVLERLKHYSSQLNSWGSGV